MAATDFIALVKKRTKKITRKNLFTDIVNGGLPIRELIQATGSKDAECLIETLAKFHPHPVYINVGIPCWRWKHIK